MTDTLRMVALLALVVIGLGLRRFFLLRRQVASVGEGLLKLRRLQKDETTYVPLAAGDAFHPLAASEAASVTQQLDALQFRILGDRMEQRAGAPRLGPSRWFAHEGGRVCGWFAVIATQSGALRPVMVFFSESEANEFFTTTRGGASPFLAQPPNLSRELIAWGEGLAMAVERHRAAVARAKGALKTVATVEDATALLQRLRANTRGWREKQSPKELLEADLHTVLNKHYDRLHRAVRQYVEDRL
jgi:hypothetical protein